MSDVSKITLAAAAVATTLLVSSPSAIAQNQPNNALEMTPQLRQAEAALKELFAKKFRELEGATVNPANSQHRSTTQGEHVRLSHAILTAHRNALENAGTLSFGNACARGIAVELTGPLKLVRAESDSSIDVLTAPAVVITALGHGQYEINSTRADANVPAGGYVTSRDDITVMSRKEIEDRSGGTYKPKWAPELPITTIQVAIKRCDL